MVIISHHHLLTVNKKFCVEQRPQWSPDTSIVAYHAIGLSRECVFLCSLSHHSKDLERRTLKPSAHHSFVSWTNCVIALRQISVTALFYLENSRRIHPRSVRACQPKDLKEREWRSTWGRGREREGERKSTRRWEREKKRERERFGSSFYMFFSSTWACPMQIGLSQECRLFYLKSSLWSLDLLLFFFHGLFPSLSFSHCYFGLLFPILPT